MSEVEYVSLAVSVATFLGWLYMWGYKMGAMNTKVDTLWQVYVKDALSETRRPHGNPKPFTDNLFTANMKVTIEKIGFCDIGKTIDDVDVVLKLEKKLGPELQKIAEENKLPYRVVLGTALLITKEFKRK